LGIGHGVGPLEEGSASVPKDEMAYIKKTGLGPVGFMVCPWQHGSGVMMLLTNAAVHQS